jgi:putative copper resistance protein D
VILAGLVASRFFHLSALLILLGCGLFPLYAERSTKFFVRMRTVVVIAVVVTLVSGVFWFAFTAAGMSGSLSGATDWSTLSLVANSTAFGHIWVIRLILLAAALLIFIIAQRHRQLWLVAATISGITLASIAWAGHGQTGQGSGATGHVISDVVHLFAAAVWMGALVGLLLLLRSSAPVREVAFALTAFSTIGPSTVALLVITGVVNSLFLIGPPSSLFTTAYGLTLVVKILLFAGMFVCAVLNRFRLTPRLAAAHDDKSEVDAMHALKQTIAAETLLALLVVAAVALLGTLAPPGTV